MSKFRIESIEFYLPFGRDSTDGTGTRSETDHHFSRGVLVTQPTECADGASDFTFDAAPTGRPTSSADAGDSDFEAFIKRFKTLPEKEKKLLYYLVEDLENGKCELSLDRTTGRTVIYNIQTAARIPENILRISNVASKTSEQQKCELNAFCDNIDRIKQDKPPSGVLHNDDMMKLSGNKKYREGHKFEYELTDVILGEGLHAKVRVSRDHSTDKSCAMKTVVVNNFRTNEIRAMFDLQSYHICPELYNYTWVDTDITLWMENLDNFRTVENVVSLLTGSGCTSDDRYKFALQVFLKLAEAVQLMHSSGWYHCDLHSGNVMLHRSHNNEIELRIIDFGSAKCKTDFERSQNKDELYQSMISDYSNILRLFCTLVIGYDCFEDIFDFRINYELQINEVSKKTLPDELKSELFSLLQMGFQIKATLMEKKFIAELAKKVNSIGVKEIARITKLIFESQKVFRCLHSNTNSTTCSTELPSVQNLKL